MSSLPAGCHRGEGIAPPRKVVYCWCLRVTPHQDAPLVAAPLPPHTHTTLPKAASPRLSSGDSSPHRPPPELGKWLQMQFMHCPFKRAPVLPVGAPSPCRTKHPAFFQWVWVSPPGSGARACTRVLVPRLSGSLPQLKRCPWEQSQPLSPLHPANRSQCGFLYSSSGINLQFSHSSVGHSG